MGEPREVRAERLTFPDIEQYLTEDDRVIIPVGAVEQHGPHMAMGTDSILAEDVGLEAARRSGVLIYPTMWYGWSENHMAFCGTVTLRPETLQAMVRDVVESLSVHGFRKFIIVNGNRRANLPPIQVAAAELMANGERVVAVADVAYLNTSDIQRIRKSEPGGIGHAGEIETSMMLHLHPDCVWMDKAVASPTKAGNTMMTAFLPPDPAFEGGSRFQLTRHPMSAKKSTKGLGVSGDPTVATAETGREVMETMVAGLVEVLNIVKRTPAPNDEA